MKLIASMMVGPGEEDRYLATTLSSLLEFCDEVRVVSEAPFLVARRGMKVTHVEPGTFFQHEGRARQTLLDWTMEGSPTHVLAIDADELVSDGAALRAVCEADDGNGCWLLSMEEVWAADGRYLWTRQDGGWRQHPVPILYRAPRGRLDGRWRIQDRALACGREPLAVRQLAGRGMQTGVSVMHFGWANRSERRARYDRYAEADGGRFHASSHLQSILFPDRRVRLAKRPWPAALEPHKEFLLEHANREPVPA